MEAYEKVRHRQYARILTHSEILYAHQIRERHFREWIPRERVDAENELNTRRRELERLRRHRHGQLVHVPSVVNTDHLPRMSLRRSTTPEQQAKLEDIINNEQCTICFEAYTSKACIQLTTCNHHMCLNCKASLVESANDVTEVKCPICRETSPF